MASVNKNFVVKNGLEVDTNLIFANADLNRVGIAVSTPEVTLDVRGQTNIKNNLDVVGLTTVDQFRVRQNATFDNSINVSATSFLNVINASGSADIAGAVNIGGNTVVDDDLTVTGGLFVNQYYGNGDTLSGIVTQIVAGFGVSITETQIPGKGVVRIDAYKPVGKTVFVSQNGDDENTGLALNAAKRTIKSAASTALYGDTIKVYPGIYVEENPIILSKTVSVQGTELRNCVITPKYPNRDIFHVNNGCHLTNLSFIGPNMIEGAAVVALQRLFGVEVDRYFDAARMIRINLDYIARESVGFLTSGFSGFAGNHREQDAARLIDLNIDYIAEETIGFLTSTSYKNPAFLIVNNSGIATDPVNCKDDIKSILNAISYDLKAGSNRKSIGAGLSYYDEGGSLLHITGISTGADGLQSYSVKQATIDAIQYSLGITTHVINNLDWSATHTTYGLLSQDFSYSPAVVSGGCTAVVNKIANRVGIITNTIKDGPSYASGVSEVYGVILENKDDCIDDVKTIWSQICFDLTRGGNTRSVAAGKAYFDEEWNLLPAILKNPLELDQTIATLDYSFNIARSVVNNNSWGGYPAANPIDVLDASYDNTTGIVTVTTLGHGLLLDDPVKLDKLVFECDSNGPALPGPTTSYFPSGYYGKVFSVNKVIDLQEFEVLVGPSTISHTYVGPSGTIQRYTNFQKDYTQVKDFAMQVDLESGFNNAINSCSNVISAIKSYVGIITTILNEGASNGITTTFPGNAGQGIDNIIEVNNALYDEESGKVTIYTEPGLKIRKGDRVEIRELVFRCTSGGPFSSQKFPSGYYGYEFYVDKINLDGSFVLNVGVSTLPHEYLGGGFIVDRTFDVDDALYHHPTGITTITAPGAAVKTGDLISVRDLVFQCNSGGGPSTAYFPSGKSGGYEFRVQDVIIDKPYSVTNAVYSNNTGIVTITVPNLSAVEGDIVEVKNLEFSCNSGAATTTFYPTGNNGFKFKVLDVVGSTIKLGVGTAPMAHTYVGGGQVRNVTEIINDTFTINVGVSSLAHTYIGPSGYVIPPFSIGVGPITQGPYVRNCTNFIPNSIGMKVDGFDAEPGYETDIGVTGTMSVDSYTQYNQGGIGVSITNGGYAQLVSIFTICDDIAIYTGTGGQCDLTNSNASFGNYGLYSESVGDSKSKSIYRYTGFVAEEAEVEQDKVIIAGIGTLRPYDGQALYFGELFYNVDKLVVINGGSGYNPLLPPAVTVELPPADARGIRAEGSVNVDPATGSITSIDVISSGSQYRGVPIVTVAPPPVGGTTATAQAVMEPIYYYIETATLPYNNGITGISTVVLTQNLNNTVSEATTVYFSRLSLQIATTISFEWVGAGTNIFKAKPALGGVTIAQNEVVKLNGGQVVFTSTNQAGNFRIGTDLTINQLTGTISGRAFSQSLLNTVTPLIIALGKG